MMTTIHKYPLFDAHFHIIDDAFPLVENQDFLPENYSCQQYLQRMSEYQLVGGAVVSGSFQAFDQSYLLAVLKELGANFVGVTQLPVTVSDEEVLYLAGKGVRALRFNLKRGGSAEVKDLLSFASRVYELAGWHVELYVDSVDLAELKATLLKLPSVSIDHLGLSRAGFSSLKSLVEKGVKVKACGFSRIDFDALQAIKELHRINPAALMFATDLPSTRAPKVYTDDDLKLLLDNFESKTLERILYQNAQEFYRLG